MKYNKSAERVYYVNISCLSNNSSQSFEKCHTSSEQSVLGAKVGSHLLKTLRDLDFDIIESGLNKEVQVFYFAK